MTTVVAVVASLLAVLAVGTGVGVLVCCVVWLKRSESIWTKAEQEEEKIVKRKRKQNGPGLKAVKIKADSELPKQTGFKNSTANSYSCDVHVQAYTTDSAIKHTDQATNSMEIAQNEAYSEIHHPVQIQEDTSAHIQEENSSQEANVTNKSNTEIKADQNVAYKSTHCHTKQSGHTSSASADESEYTYISSEQANSAMISMARNVAYLRSHHHTTLDVIYEENQSNGAISRDRRTQAGHNSDYNLNVHEHAHTKSETLV